MWCLKCMVPYKLCCYNPTNWCVLGVEMRMKMSVGVFSGKIVAGMMAYIFPSLTDTEPLQVG